MVKSAPSHFQATVSWSLIATAYAVAFLQRVSLQSFIDLLARDLNVTAQGAGILASGYFYGYVILQLPSGILVDVFGVRRMILISLAASSIGTALFAISPNIAVSFVSRMITSCGDALVFTAMIKLVAQQFSDTRFGLMSGLSQVSGYIGGMLATTPLAVAVAIFGWRACFGVIDIIIIGNWFALLFILPGKESASSGTLGENPRWGSVSRSISDSLKRVFNALKTREAWGCALTFSAHFVAVTTLTAAWGMPMLMHAYGLSRSDASTPMLVFMFTNAIGSIIFGYFADRIRSLPAALIVSCFARIALLIPLAPMFGAELGLPLLTLLFAIFGIVAGGTVPLILKCLKTIYSASHVGVGVSINSTLAGIIAGLIQPLIGAALEATWNGKMDANGLVYSSRGYNFLVLMLVVSSLPGLVAPLLLRRKLSKQ